MPPISTTSLIKWLEPEYSIMEDHLLAYALGLIGVDIIMLVTIRNRYMPLISCAIALVGVEGFLLIMVWHGSSLHLLVYIIVLFLVDVIILLSIWPFISGLPNQASDKTQVLNPFGWLLYTSSIIGTIVTTRWFRLILYLLFILWCIIGGLRGCKSFPDG